jgi:hypothetical protein
MSPPKNNISSLTTAIQRQLPIAYFLLPAAAFVLHPS